MVKKGNKRIMITVSDSQAAEYDVIARKLGVSRSSLVRLAIAFYVKSFELSDDSCKGDNLSS